MLAVTLPTGATVEIPLEVEAAGPDAIAAFLADASSPAAPKGRKPSPAAAAAPASE